MTHSASQGALRASSTPRRRGDFPAAEAAAEHARVSGARLIDEMKKERGNALVVLADLEKEFPNDPRRQLNELLVRFKWRSATGRTRGAGLETVRTYRRRLNKMLTDLCAKEGLNARPRNLRDVSTKNAKALINLWVARGHTPKYIKNLGTALRRLLIWIDKPALPPLEKLVDQPEAVRCQSVAREPKTLEAAGIDPDALLKLAYELDPLEAVRLELQLRFAMRVTETLMLKPLQADRGNELFLDTGTKGGRPRFVPIDTPEARQVLDRAKQLAGAGTLTSETRRSLKQARGRFYRFCKKIGLTKKQGGATPHSLRHTALCNYYEHLTGTPAPVYGGRPLSQELAREAQRLVAERAGHGRVDASRPYIGSPKTMGRMQRQQLSRLLDTFGRGSVLARLHQAGLAELWILGEPADGWPVRGPVTFACSVDGGTVPHDDTDLLVFLAQLVNAPLATLMSIETARALNQEELQLTGVAR
ncbi:MAG: tyrosine-type recombinase/integrase [Vicinamibacterales bacterium]